MSTARHQLAGAPGTGTTIDNMRSRVKAWGCMNGTSAPATIRGSFNVSSVSDVGVGDLRPVYTAAMTDGAYGMGMYQQDTAGGIGMCGGGTVVSTSPTGTRLYTANASGTSTDGSPAFLMDGDLA